MESQEELGKRIQEGHGQLGVGSNLPHKPYEKLLPFWVGPRKRLVVSVAWGRAGPKEKGIIASKDMTTAQKTFSFKLLMENR